MAAPPPDARPTRTGPGSFILRHPAATARVLVLLVLAVVILQNVEPTDLDLLFWSVRDVPKLVVIVGAMVIGALLWEFTRRLWRGRG